MYFNIHIYIYLNISHLIVIYIRFDFMIDDGFDFKICIKCTNGYIIIRVSVFYVFKISFSRHFFLKNMRNCFMKRTEKEKEKTEKKRWNKKILIIIKGIIIKESIRKLNILRCYINAISPI